MSTYFLFTPLSFRKNTSGFNIEFQYVTVFDEKAQSSKRTDRIQKFVSISQGSPQGHRRGRSQGRRELHLYRPPSPVCVPEGIGKMQTGCAIHAIDLEFMRCCAAQNQQDMVRNRIRKLFSRLVSRFDTMTNRRGVTAIFKEQIVLKLDRRHLK